MGTALLSNASFDDIREWIVSRRERPDGTGYPRGLHGLEIPLEEARILAVAEAYIAMPSDRVHRPALVRADARSELLRGAGTQFDAAVVHAFVRSAVLRTAQPAPVAA